MNFEPGEIAVFVGGDGFNFLWAGRECVVLGRWVGEAVIHGEKIFILDGYLVRFPGETPDRCVERTWLRKRKPPAYESGWDFLAEITDGWDPRKANFVPALAEKYGKKERA